MRQKTVESCAIDGDGYCIEREGQVMGVLRWVLQTELGRYKTEREMASQRLRESKISTAVRRKRGLCAKQKRGTRTQEDGGGGAY